MTKAEFIKAIQANMGEDTTAVAAGKALDAVEAAIAATLQAGGAVKLTGIGTLEVRATAARKGRNPRTGKAIDIPAGKKVGFSMAKAMKTAL